MLKITQPDNQLCSLTCFLVFACTSFYNLVLSNVTFSPNFLFFSFFPLSFPSPSPDPLISPQTQLYAGLVFCHAWQLLQVTPVQEKEQVHCWKLKDNIDGGLGGYHPYIQSNLHNEYTRTEISIFFAVFLWAFKSESHLTSGRWSTTQTRFLSFCTLKDVFRCDKAPL